MPGPGTMTMNILKALRTERERQGMSKAELARRVGASRSQFSAMEDGASMPTLGRTMQMASALGMVVRIERETVTPESQATERTAL